MNKKQLDYIKEKQQENVFVIPMVSMRDSIDNAIIDELETIYNPDIGGVETEYKSTLNDISMPHDFLDNTYMISIIRKYGSSAVMVYMYLHAKMCGEGYKIVWNEIQQDIIKVALSGMYKVDAESVDEIISAFLDAELLHIIEDGKKQYITSVYQVFIFERVSAKRLRDRIYKKNARAGKKEEKLKIETKLPVFEDEQEDDFFDMMPGGFDMGVPVSEAGLVDDGFPVNGADLTDDGVPCGWCDFNDVEIPFT